MWKATLLCLVATAFIVTNASFTRKKGTWWESAVLYQIYPRSFKDSDGDGIGDLKGITSKIDYIRTFADAIWLSPIFSSPQKDFGYDVSNYTDIYFEYGTLQDFDELVAKAKSVGLKVLLDFVPNHTSDEHEWFKKSVQHVPPYNKYYIWNDGKLLPNGTRLPPNNWLSMMGGSAWKWNKDRGQFYYHQFLESQPDLNYDNEKLKMDMENVISFWLKRGIDGYRVDAVPHLYEDALLRDEPRSKEDVPPDDYDYLIHSYTRDLNETYNVVQSWRELMDKYSKDHNESPKLALMEVGGKDFSKTMMYYNIGVDPMNFAFVSDLNNSSTVKDFRYVIERWLNSTPTNETTNWVVGNHDVWRVASRYPNRADQISMLSAVLPGLWVLYNGDEIGMVNRYFTYEETVDPAGCNAGPDKYQLKSRDPERTPFQWDDSVSAGFSKNPNTWLPVNDNYKTLNFALQNGTQYSHYKIVKSLSDMRKRWPLLVTGDTVVYNIQDKLLVVRRKLFGWAPVAALVNFTDENIELDGRSFLGNNPGELNIYAASVNSGVKIGEIVKVEKVFIPKTSTIILTSTWLTPKPANSV